MAKALKDWLDEDVVDLGDKPLRWLGEYHFFRDPPRPTFADLSCFFAPADGVILYQKELKPSESLVTCKGKEYTLQAAMGDASYDSPSLVVGIFMTFYDVHVNRIPYPGRLSYRLLDPIDTFNHPMLEMEQELLERRRVAPEVAGYLHHNQRMLNRVDSISLGDSYYMVQMADYDVDCITPFELRQNHPVLQGMRFSQIRFGSQFDLIIPLSERYRLEPVNDVGDHVEGGIDPLVSITFHERSTA